MSEFKIFSLSLYLQEKCTLDDGDISLVVCPYIRDFSLYYGSSFLSEKHFEVFQLNVFMLDSASPEA